MTKAEELMATTYRLARADFTLSQIEQLISIERRLHRLDEASCNGTIDEAGYDRREKRLMVKAAELCAERNTNNTKQLPLIPYHQSDPRGGALYLCDASLPDLHSRYSQGICV